MHLVLNDIDLGRDYQRVLSEVAKCGDHVSPRGLPAVEVRPLVLRLPNPARCITKRPGFNRALMWLEVAQLLAGAYDRELYAAASPSAASLITPYGAYGPRAWPQLLDVEAELQRDNASRRAVVYIGRPDDARLAAQYPPEQLDSPCTLTWQFFARGGQLEMLVNMRSWDLVWGLCPTPEMRVLTADLRWTPAGNLKPGDQVISFDEFSPPIEAIRKVITPNGISTIRRGNRKWKIGTVKRTGISIKDVYEITLMNGDKLRSTAEHPWLTNIHRWRMTSSLSAKRGKGSPRAKLVKLLPVWKTGTSRDDGLLAAAFDGEGCLIRPGLKFAQNQNVFRRDVREALLRNAFISQQQADNDDLSVRTVARVLRFLGQIRPSRLLEKFAIGKFALERRDLTQHKDGSKNIEVKSVAYIGQLPVVELDIDAKTYVLEGYGSHNSYDVPAFASVQLALAAALGLAPGPYTHVAGSGHIYERHLGVAALVEPTAEQLPSVNLDGQPMASLRESAVIALDVARRTLLGGEAAPQVGSWAPAFDAWVKRAQRHGIAQ